MIALETYSSSVAILKDVCVALYRRNNLQVNGDASSHVIGWQLCLSITLRIIIHDEGNTIHECNALAAKPKSQVF